VLETPLDPISPGAAMGAAWILSTHHIPHKGVGVDITPVRHDHSSECEPDAAHLLSGVNNYFRKFIENIQQVGIYQRTVGYIAPHCGLIVVVIRFYM
jgi:hypothetical protein